jgi:hypothetical protein
MQLVPPKYWYPPPQLRRPQSELLTLLMLNTAAWYDYRFHIKMINTAITTKAYLSLPIIAAVFCPYLYILPIMTANKLTDRMALAIYIYVDT